MTDKITDEVSWEITIICEMGFTPKILFSYLGIPYNIGMIASTILLHLIITISTQTCGVT